MCCRFPHEILDVTKNHLNSLKAILVGNPIVEKVEAVLKKVNEVRKRFIL